MDRQVLRQLYEEHGWHVQSRCTRILGNADEAQDVSHEVFVKLIHAWNTLGDQRQVLPWLFRVATNACIDRLRLRKDHDAGELDALPAHQQCDVATRLLVSKLLSHFRAEDQVLVILRYVDECTLEEIEEISGLTRKTISKRLNKFRTRAQEFTRKSQLLEEVRHERSAI